MSAARIGWTVACIAIASCRYPAGCTSDPAQNEPADAPAVVESTPVEATRPESAVPMRPEPIVEPDVLSTDAGPLPDGAIARIGGGGFDFGGRVLAIDVSPSGRRVAAVGWHDRLAVWDARTGHRALSVDLGREGAFAVEFSPDGRYVAIGGAGHRTAVFDALKGSMVAEWGDNSHGQNHALAFTPDGSAIAFARQGAIEIRDSSSGELRRILEPGRSGGSSSLAFTPDGDRLVDARGREVMVWSVNDGTIEHTLGGFEDVVTDVEMSPDGRFLATVTMRDDAIRLYAFEGFGLVRTMDADGARVLDVELSADGERIAAATSDGVLLWRAATGQVEDRLQRGASAKAVAFAPDGETLAVADRDSDVQLWDLSAKNRRATTASAHAGTITALAFAGARLISAGTDGSVRAWSRSDWTSSWAVEPDIGRATALAVDPERTQLAVGGSDGTVVRLGAADGSTLGIVHRGERPVADLAWAPGGSRLASGGLDRVVLVHDLAAGSARELGRTHAEEIEALAFSPDGGTLAVGAFSRQATPLGFWNLSTQTRTSTHDVGNNHASDILYLSADRVVIASHGAYVVRTRDGGIVHELANDGHRVHRVALSPDRTLVAGVGDDGYLWLWRAVDGEQRYAGAADSSTLWTVAWSDDGAHLATAGEGAQILVWNPADLE